MKTHKVGYFNIAKLSRAIARLGYRLYRWNENRQGTFCRDKKKENYLSYTPSQILELIDYDNIKPRRGKLRRTR